MAITTIPEVREEIQQNINTNNNRAITGQILQTTLVDMLDTVDDVKANTTGYYEGMSVGLADNLISPDTENDSASWLYRSTAGDKDVSSGFATIEGMKGNTIVWNQLLGISTKASFTAAGITYTNNNNGTWSVSGTSTYYTTPGLGLPTIAFQVNHYYLLKGSCGKGMSIYLEDLQSSGSKSDNGTGTVFLCQETKKRSENAHFEIV